MKKLYQFLKLFFFANLGSFLGKVMYEAIWYRNHPEYYALTSAPWYTNILVYGVCALGIAVILGIILWLLKRKLDQNQE